MIYKRKIVQYNDLVLSNAVVFHESPSSVSYKSFAQELGFTHGDYAPHKSQYPYAQSMNLSATITLNLKEVACEYRPFLKQFANTELSKVGKLWSIENNTLEWAFAEVSGKTEADAKKDQFEWDVDFYLPEGIWHKADKQKTFLVPHDPCEFLDCYDYKEISPCFTGDCCHCGNRVAEYCKCCDCNDVSQDMALCYVSGTVNGKNGLQDFYDCGAGYRIVYNCALGEKFFMSTYYGADHLGQKFCSDCGDIAGLLYSDTEIPTTGVKIRLHGNVKDPYIEINGNGNIIKGEYDGTLIINQDGSVYFDDGCGACDPISVDKWIVPEGMTYGWTVYPQNNRLVIQSGNCCGTVCAYIEVDSLTA